MKKNKNIIYFLTTSLLCAFFNVCDAQSPVWQWSIPVRGSNTPNIPSKAYLWIPENCKMIRGVIFAQHNMEEQSILENPGFRAAMTKLGLAEVWVSPAYDLKFDFSTGAGSVFEGIMNDLANASGYGELNTAPFIGVGHSAAASAPYYMAVWKPDRALAAISVSGQWPFVRNTVFTPDVWGSRNLDFIPCLETMGEYEAANTWSTEGLKERQANPLLPLSMLACPAQGHFAATQEKIDYIALYIRKVMQYRAPQLNSPDQRLRPVDPTKSGWLVDKWRFNQLPLASPASVSHYKGDPKEAFWFFDQELAEATAAIQSRHRDQKPQLIGYVQQGKLVEQRNTHLQVNLKFEPLADGTTFHLKGAFYDTVPGGSPRPATWVGQPVGSQVGHAAANPINIEIVSGPVLKLNDSTFQIHPRPGYWASPGSYSLTFAAVHQGDNVFKPAVQQAQMNVPYRNNSGSLQHIEFPQIPDQHPGSKKIQLTAKSDAGVPVSYYIENGPAIIKDDKIDLTVIPPKSKFPVKVTVVAWQYGRSNPPQLQTAEPVIREFWIRK